MENKKQKNHKQEKAMETANLINRCWDIFLFACTCAIQAEKQVNQVLDMINLLLFKAFININEHCKKGI